jgi:hypothetical protein
MNQLSPSLSVLVQTLSFVDFLSFVILFKGLFRMTIKIWVLVPGKTGTTCTYVLNYACIGTQFVEWAFKCQRRMGSTPIPEKHNIT